MILVTNPGSNLDPSLARQMGVRLTPQRIHVDGEDIDTREGISLAQVEDFIARAKKWPYVVGSTAAEQVAVLEELRDRHDDILFVTTSKKVIRTYYGAVSASRVFTEKYPQMEGRVQIHDNGVTDAGAGLATIAAYTLAGRGISPTTISATLDRVAAKHRMIFLLRSLKYSVNGGRTSFMRSKMAEMLGLAPVLAFVDGELKLRKKVKLKRDPVDVILEAFREEVPAGTKIWASVFHGAVPRVAQALRERIQAEWDVVFLYERELSSSIYLHSGKGTIGATMFNVTDEDALHAPPPFPQLDAGAQLVFR